MTCVRRRESRMSSFEFNNYVYEVHETLAAFPDYDRLLLATRRVHVGKRLAEQTQLVVLKPLTIPDQTEALERALEEIRLARQLNHPALGKLHGYAVDNESRQAYVVMEHHHGRSLLALMTTAVLAGRELSPAFAAHVAAEIADALEHAHRARGEDGEPLTIVHRAVGPMSIHIGRLGKVKLLNFGSAYSGLLDRLQTRRELLRGDPAYIAPEIYRAFMHPEARQRDVLTPRQLDGRADIFSLGLVLLEMLTASYPLDSHEELWRGVKERFPPNVQSEHSTLIPLHELANRALHFGPKEVERLSENVEAPLQRILARALRSRPEDRYATAGQMRDDLYAYLRGLPYLYGAKQVVEEVQAILRHVSRVEHPAAYPGVERGSIPAALDLPDERITEKIH